MDTLMGKKPKVPPPAPMPDEDAIKQESRKKAASLSARSGRESTILSDRLGG